MIRFADCELNLDRVVLRRGGEEIRVEPQVFDVLAYLVQHRGTVVRKEELLDAVWGDRFVSESALTTRIKAVRQAVGDDGSQQLIIRTVHGKGYEFVATVEEVEERRTEVALSPVATGATIGVRVQPLIGRDALLEQLAEMIVDHRLVTLIGPGGVGKTSLAMELARMVGGQFEDGVHVVELVGVVDQDATAAALATAIDVNLRKSSSIDDAIVDLLRPRHSLLVLDNCEHLIEPVAELVARILREAPTVAIVATSREPLAVAGERLWTVDPLPTGPLDLFASELASANWPRSPRSHFSLLEPGPLTRLSPWMRSLGRWLSRSVDVSMESLWRLNWPLPGRVRSELPKSLIDSTSVLGYSRRCEGEAILGTGPCTTPSAGPTTCSNLTSGPSSQHCQCSPVLSSCVLQRQWHQEATPSTC